MSEIGEEEIARALYETQCTEYRAEPWWGHEPDEIKRLYRMQARAVLALLHPALERARGEERERCAKVADEVALRQPNSMFYTSKEEGMAAAAQFIAAAIRKGSGE